MADPIKYQRAGIARRTPRDRARAWGASVPDKPAFKGYCSLHGHTHKLDSCGAARDIAAVAQEGGKAKLPANISPIKKGR